MAGELAGVVENSDVSSGDEHGDGLAGVASSDADVVEASGVTDGELNRPGMVHCVRRFPF